MPDSRYYPVRGDAMASFMMGQMTTNSYYQIQFEPAPRLIAFWAFRLQNLHLGEQWPREGGSPPSSPFPVHCLAFVSGNTILAILTESAIADLTRGFCYPALWNRPAPVSPLRSARPRRHDSYRFVCCLTLHQRLPWSARITVPGRCPKNTSVDTMWEPPLHADRAGHGDRADHASTEIGTHRLHPLQRTTWT
jgi:hypothetical protein